MYSNLLIYTSYFVIAVSAGWCAWHFRSIQPALRMLVWFIFLSAIVQAGAEILAHWGINNLFLSHLYAVIGFTLLTGFYQAVLRPFVAKVFLPLLSAGFLILSIVTVLVWEPLNTFNSIPLTVESVVCVILVLSTFILTLNEEMNQHLRPILRSLNWINSGFFLYFAGSLLLFFYGDTIINAVIEPGTVFTWQAHTVLSIVLHSCLLRGLCLSLKT